MSWPWLVWVSSFKCRRFLYSCARPTSLFRCWFSSFKCLGRGQRCLLKCTKHWLSSLKCLVVYTSGQRFLYSCARPTSRCGSASHWPSTGSAPSNVVASWPWPVAFYTRPTAPGRGQAQTDLAPLRRPRPTTYDLRPRPTTYDLRPRARASAWPWPGRSRPTNSDAELNHAQVRSSAAVIDI
jgi:hypothetical protein